MNPQIQPLDPEDRRIIGLTLIVLTAIVAGFGGCVVDARRDRAFAEHGYTQQIAPGSSAAIWVNPCPCTNSTIHIHTP